MCLATSSFSVGSCQTVTKKLQLLCDNLETLKVKVVASTSLQKLSDNFQLVSDNSLLSAFRATSNMKGVTTCSSP